MFVLLFHRLQFTEAQQFFETKLVFSFLWHLWGRVCLSHCALFIPFAENPWLQTQSFTGHVFPSFLPSFQDSMAFYLRSTRRLPSQITVSGNHLDLSSPLVTAPNCKPTSNYTFYCLCLCCPWWRMEQWNTWRLRGPLGHLLLQRKMEYPAPRKHTCNPRGSEWWRQSKVASSLQACLQGRSGVYRIWKDGKGTDFKAIIMQMS